MPNLSKHTSVLGHLTHWPPGNVAVIFKCIIFKRMVKFMSTSCEIALMWMPQNTFDNISTFAQVMACCLRHQTITSASYNPDLGRHMTSLGHNMLIHLWLRRYTGGVTDDKRRNIFIDPIPVESIDIFICSLCHWIIHIYGVSLKAYFIFHFYHLNI